MIKRTGILFLSACVVAPNCWAPIMQAPPKGHPMLHDATQGELAHNQEQQRTQGEVGFVPQKSSDTPEVPAEVSDHQAGANLVSAQNESEQSDAERAKKNLQQAETTIEKDEGHSSNWLWGAIFGVFGFGTVMGFRSWAAKNIPVPTNPKAPKPEEAGTKRQVW